MNSFVFVDNSLGWMISQNVNIYNTIDWGKNWEMQYNESSTIEDYYMYLIAASDSNNVFTLNDINQVMSRKTRRRTI